jgi:hypothetical protein
MLGTFWTQSQEENKTIQIKNPDFASYLLPWKPTYLDLQLRAYTTAE